MADFNEKFRVVMLQGAKGEPYDDTQLRQDINEMLANVPYIEYTEDNGFELPIYTINDNSVTAYSCWSSQKTQEELNGIIYTISGQDNSCNKTYSEIMAILDEKIPKITIKHGASINFVDYAIKVSNMGLIISARTNEGKVTIEHSNNNNISVTFTVENFQNDIDALGRDIETINTNIGSLGGEVSDIQSKEWKWAFNITSDDGVKYIDFTDKATSTILILTQHDTSADCNSLFLVRKTASDNQDAMIIGNAGGIVQSGSATMPIRATVVDVQGIGKRIAIRSQFGGSAMVYYQIIE